MLDVMILLAASFFGTLGYAFLLRIEYRLVPSASIAGLLSYGLYMLVDYFTNDLFLSNFSGALLASVSAYLLAIFYRVPATVFYTPAIIPLVPGGLLYYTMFAAISANTADFLSYGGDALLVGLGLASGIILGTVAVRIARTCLKLRGARHKNEES